MEKIAFMEDGDFDKNGNLILETNQPLVVMMSATYCGYCKQAKPEFIKFANEYRGKVIPAFIEIDGVLETEKKLGQRMSKIIPNFRGVPMFLIFAPGLKGGKLLGIHDGERTSEGLKKFTKKYI